MKNPIAKPCPFCGARHLDIDESDIEIGHVYAVYCSGCGTSGPVSEVSPQGAVLAWNVRPSRAQHNARLIAAAPEMANLLERLSGWRARVNCEECDEAYVWSGDIAESEMDSPCTCAVRPARDLLVKIDGVSDE